MGLITREVEIGLNPQTISYYESKGYYIPRVKNKDGKITVLRGTKIIVKVEDLTNGSNAEVEVKCDCEDCENPYLKPINWHSYLKCVRENGKYYCQKCAKKLFAGKSYQQTNLLKSISFEQWCYDNLDIDYANEILSRWDCEKNRCLPSEVSYLSMGIDGKGYWFKCLNHIGHSSELKCTTAFISNYKKRGYSESLNCKQCNSFGQYLIDTYGENTFKLYWSERNTVNPFNVSKYSHEEVLINCLKKSFHGDYPMKCYNFVKGDRCPYCFNKKIHPLDSLGTLCPQVFKIWSDKNDKSPYQYSPMSSSKKVWWKCECGKHEDYKRSIKNSNLCDFRCPECTRERDESFLQEKVRLYLNELGYEVKHERDCTLKPKNIIEPPRCKDIKRSKGNLRYDNELIIKNKHLFIEVMGYQHDDNIAGFHKNNSKRYGTTTQQEFEYQVSKDKYKEQYVYDQGERYYYLSIWYYNDDDNETYKELINNKINEILK